MYANSDPLPVETNTFTPWLKALISVYCCGPPRWASTAATAAGTRSLRNTGAVVGGDDDPPPEHATSTTPSVAAASTRLTAGSCLHDDGHDHRAPPGPL